jgi:hypothetical protein
VFLQDKAQILSYYVESSEVTIKCSDLLPSEAGLLFPYLESLENTALLRTGITKL